MFQASEIQRLIEAGLSCEFVAIEGDDGVHFSGIVVSAEFEGKPRVRQHQAVYGTLYGTLGSLMGNEIHALQLQTYTPAQWAEFQKSL
ncbi:MAG: BolA family transcriptional regulator [Candidatus Dactylopiibacterium carminicum]|uniref:BolA family transcriptional regulator n=1 Tax=Candidatus Dactylopiibacterium carminicum TaxID=857335 RepID=A0A272ESH5_9RHOO|nr:BolA/IbaG family iron-sulfur metabolism protein [Candidatus Dactylopiibacterium carminicum]KAF7599076.1 BolA family transcriptional regulator [Candidatus Dactylopiibacterium carminicum]PAS93073.1 MAG: BolA family transcriptional regulator [Candidatus Dactylopiibacterium carminicum]PAS96638.1 MAG: BolA family transcriptional regulator [Candidatus Dactylopiibacterium carminicum]PAS99087.1 MAG: BolA family transcriptional regulator [Candidatus Dactylopiibacterium carminicum]